MIKTKVNGLSTTIAELEEIVKELKKEKDSLPNIHWQLNIINKDGTSDGWTFDRRKYETNKIYWCKRCLQFHRPESSIGGEHQKYDAGIMKSRRK